jgi:hypothetical protein
MFANSCSESTKKTASITSLNSSSSHLRKALGVILGSLFAGESGKRPS